jgi:hypothetical protein
MIPIIDVKFETLADLMLARALQRRGLAVRVVLAHPSGVFAQSLPRNNLADSVDALDAATDVVRAPEFELDGEDTQQAGDTRGAVAAVAQANAA